jgi:hypothetical protein
VIFEQERDRFALGFQLISLHRHEGSIQALCLKPGVFRFLELPKMIFISNTEKTKKLWTFSPDRPSSSPNAPSVELCCFWKARRLRILANLYC